MSEIVISMHSSPRAIGIGSLQNQATTRPQGALTTINEVKHLVLVEVFDDVISRNDIVGRRVVIEVIEHAFLFHIRGHLPGQCDLVRADINPYELAISPL